MTDIELVLQRLVIDLSKTDEDAAKLNAWAESHGLTVLQGMLFHIVFGAVSAHCSNDAGLNSELLVH